MKFTIINLLLIPICNSFILSYAGQSIKSNEPYYINKLQPTLSYNINKNLLNSKVKYVPCDINSNEECLAICKNEECKILSSKSTLNKFKTIFYIGIWYTFSTLYSIENKIRLNLLNLPYFQSFLSLGTGTIFINILWLLKLRKKPNINKQKLIKYLPLSFFHSIGHISAVIAVSGGAVSFTQIVKAAEPVFTCGLNWIILGSTINLSAFISLISLVLGVSLASISSLTFTWISFWGSMVSNIAFAARNVCSRVALTKENINPENLFAILTIFSFLFSIPIMIIFEGKKIPIIIMENTNPTPIIFISSIKTGLYFYFYNEAAMKVLKNLNPVSHSVANSLKRIIILLTCIIFFKTPLNQNGVIGAVIAIVSSYMYSMTKNK